MIVEIKEGRFTYDLELDDYSLNIEEVKAVYLDGKNVTEVIETLYGDMDTFCEKNSDFKTATTKIATGEYTVMEGEEEPEEDEYPSPDDIRDVQFDNELLKQL